MLPDKKSRFIPVLPAATLVMLLMAASMVSQAATLGDELILSRLGDPVEVEIAVLQWDDIDFTQLQIGVGTPPVYESFGLEYLPVLDSLKFNLVGPNLEGDVKVLVSTREPILEPYLQLLLVLRWPGGSLLREYVLLFDPPRSSQVSAVVTTVTTEVPVPSQPLQTSLQPIVTAQPPQTNTQPVIAAEREDVSSTVAQTGARQDLISAVPPQPSAAPDIAQEPATLVEQEPVLEQRQEETRAAAVQEVTEAQIPAPQNSAPESDISAVAQSPSSNERAVAAGRQVGTYLVQAGDSLWDIASRLGPPNADVYQILLSLYELNPQAFSNGNISLLQSGMTLQLPTTADASRISAATAQSVFEQHWGAGSTGTQATQSDEALPALGSLLASEIMRPEVNPTAELQNNPDARAPAATSGDRVIVTNSARITAPATVPGQTAIANAGASLSSAEAANVAVQPVAVANTTAVSVPAIISLTTDMATSASANPYMGGISVSAQFMQEILAAKRQQVVLLEARMSVMDTRMQEIGQLTAQLNTSLEAALTERDRQQNGFRRDNFLLGGLILLLSAVLLAIIVLAFKVAAQIRVQHLLLQSKVRPLMAGATGSFSEPATVTNVTLVTTTNGGDTSRFNSLVGGQALAVSILEEEPELAPAQGTAAESVDSIELNATQGETADPLELNATQGETADPLELNTTQGETTDPLELNTTQGETTDPLELNTTQDVATLIIAAPEATPVAPPNDLATDTPVDDELDKPK